MKKICLILFLVLVSTTAFPYKITNSPASKNTIAVELGKTGLFLTAQAFHKLVPGESGA